MALYEKNSFQGTPNPDEIFMDTSHTCNGQDCMFHVLFPAVVYLIVSTAKYAQLT